MFESLEGKVSFALKNIEFLCLFFEEKRIYVYKFYVVKNEYSSFLS